MSNQEYLEDNDRFDGTVQAMLAQDRAANGSYSLIKQHVELLLKAGMDEDTIFKCTDHLLDQILDELNIRRIDENSLGEVDE